MGGIGKFKKKILPRATLASSTSIIIKESVVVKRSLTFHETIDEMNKRSFSGLSIKLFTLRIPKLYKFIKGTVSVISSDPKCKNGNAQFTTVPLKAMSD